MEFFLEMLLTAAVALFFSFLVAKLVTFSMAGNTGEGGGNDPTSDHAEEELGFALKVDAPVVQSQRSFRVDENVELVDRVGSEDDRVADELQEARKGEELVVPSEEAESLAAVEAESLAAVEAEFLAAVEAEFLAAVSPENVILPEMTVRGEDERRDSAEEISCECEELIVQTTEAESAASVSPENAVTEEETMIRGQEEGSQTTQGRSACVESEETGDVVAAESEEVKVEEVETVEESEDKEERSTEGEGEGEEEKELSIEEDDDWEGIEWSELEKAFAAAAKLLEESRKAEEIGDEAKMDLYGLHKIATEGSCREAQPMAVMVTARAKWNAWQKLGNMSQEDAMERYLALISKEIPGLMNTDHTVGKMPEMETSVVSPPNSGSLEDPTTLDITEVASSKNGER